MAKKLAGKVALVTGASSGIGEATAIALAEEGARVAMLARRSDRLEKLVKRIKDAGGEAVPIVVDLMNEAQLREAIHRTKETFGRIDIMVNNAGVMLLGKIEGLRECRAFKHLDTIRRVLLTVLPPCGHGSLWIGIQNERPAVHASRSHSQAERQGGFPTPPFLCHECNNVHSIE